MIYTLTMSGYNEIDFNSSINMGGDRVTALLCHYGEQIHLSKQSLNQYAEKQTPAWFINLKVFELTVVYSGSVLFFFILQKLRVTLKLLLWIFITKFYYGF